MRRVAVKDDLSTQSLCSVKVIVYVSLKAVAHAVGTHVSKHHDVVGIDVGKYIGKQSLGVICREVASATTVVLESAESGKVRIAAAVAQACQTVSPRTVVGRCGVAYVVYHGLGALLARSLLRDCYLGYCSRGDGQVYKVTCGRYAVGLCSKRGVCA